MSNMRNIGEGRRKIYAQADIGFSIGKVPPHAADLEEAILGAVLLTGRQAFTDAASILSPESFYKNEHRLIWETIIKLDAESKPFDILMVCQRLRADGQLDQVGGSYAVSKLTDRVASDANIEEHSMIVQELYVKREQIRFAGEVYNEAYEQTTDAFQINDKILTESNRIAALLGSGDGESTPDLAREVITRAETASVKQGMTGIATGFKEQDALFGGLQNEWLRIIAARPAMGKTSLAMQEAYNMAVNGVPVAFFSLEMSGVDLLRRVISIDSTVYLSRIKSGQMEPHQWDKVQSSVDRVSNSNLHIRSKIFTLNGIRAELRRMRDKYGIKAAYIDYLQLIQHDRANSNREVVVSEISRTLKLTAKALGIPITALSQLSRQVENRGGSKRPQLSDLRESGAIEQDADVVQFLYRPEYYEFTESHLGLPVDGLAELITAKNRDGSTGDIPLRFIKELTKFTDYDTPVQTAETEPIVTDRFNPLKPSTSF